MDKEIIISRIDTILKHIDEIQNDIKDMSFEEFKKSDLYVRATCFSLVQIGEHMSKVEESIGECFKDVPWKSARKMRNLIVHVYNNVKAEIVYETAKNDLDELKEKFEYIKNTLVEPILD